jgi:formyltetrahydrofolate-dependent phosphoribosylglycinamide formyltransferase
MQRTLMVLVSGAGTTLENLCAKIHHKKLDAKIVCVIANHANISAADVANKWDIPYWTLDPKIYPPREKWDSDFHNLVEVYNPGLIILAGYDRLLKIPPNYEERVLNIHPSLLPRYGGKGMYGDRVHKAVLESGDEATGCTVHVCDKEYDRGRIILQQIIKVAPDDSVESLRKRVQNTERNCFPIAIENHFRDLIAKNMY